MNVFLTGGAGYIGSVCVEELLNAGHQVTVFDNLSEGHKAALDSRAVFVNGSLDDRKAITEAVAQSKAEAVIHFARTPWWANRMLDPGKVLPHTMSRRHQSTGAVVASAFKSLYSVPHAPLTGCPNGFQ